MTVATRGVIFDLIISLMHHRSVSAIAYQPSCNKDHFTLQVYDDTKGPHLLRMQENQANGSWNLV